MPEKKVMSSEIFAVYGTLRKGEENWMWGLRQAQEISLNKTICGYQMFDWGGYPFCVYTGNEKDVITVDVFKSFDKVKNNQIISMELGAGYYKDIVVIGGALPASIFLYENPADQFPRIYSGDWVAYKEHIENSSRIVGCL